MKNKFLKYLTLGVVTSTLLTPINSFAYEEDDYYIGENEETGEEYWYLDDNDNTKDTINVDFYIYAQKEDVNYSTYKSYYTFDGFSDLPEGYDRIHFCKEFLIAGNNPVVDLEHGSVFCFQFNLEPGEYCFSFPNAEGNNTIRTLTRDFNSPMVGAGYYTSEDYAKGNIEIVTLKEGRGVYRIYSYFGSDEFINDKDSLIEYRTWAKENDEGWDETVKEFYGEDAAEKEAVLKELVNPTVVPEEETVSEDFVPSEGRVVSSETVVVEETEEEPVKEDKKPNYLVIIIGFAVFAGFGAISFYKKSKE